MAGRLSAARVSHNQASADQRPFGQQTSGKGGDEPGGFFLPGISDCFHARFAKRGGYTTLGQPNFGEPSLEGRIRPRRVFCCAVSRVLRNARPSAVRLAARTVSDMDRLRRTNTTDVPTFAPKTALACRIPCGRPSRFRITGGTGGTGLGTPDWQPLKDNRAGRVKTRACPGDRAPPYADSKDTPALTDPGAPFDWQANIKVPR